MDLNNKKRFTKYDRVMSRLYNRSISNVRPKFQVTRHEIPSSVSVGAKPSSSNVNSSLFSELPVVLNDYSPEAPVRSTYVVKPRRTLKSMDPAISPYRMASKVNVKPTRRIPDPKKSNIKAGGSAPLVSSRGREAWSDTHLRQCLSSRSHTRLKDLKVTISWLLRYDMLFEMYSSMMKPFISPSINLLYLH